MKAAFIFAILSLVAAVQAKYDLSCAKSELSIRWPSYESNSEYYVCSRLFGRQLTVACNPGEVFTFVLQSCTSPNRYIPAPALEVLPTASPLLSQPNENGYLTPIEVPLKHPPVLSPNIIEVSAQQPSLKPPTFSIVPNMAVDKPKVIESKPVQSEEIGDVVEEPVKTIVPLPPTPPPTPPVIKVHGKKPSSSSGKKPTGKKKKSTTTDSVNSSVSRKPTKKPKKAPGKATPTKKATRKTSKGDRTPKKTTKKPKAANKKSANAEQHI